VSFSLTENLEFISLGIFLSSFNIRLTEPSYDGYTSISTGCSKSKFNLSVSKSIREPLDANNSAPSLSPVKTSSLENICPLLSFHLLPYLTRSSPFLGLTALLYGTKNLLSIRYISSSTW